jgi:hypothetical protein
VWFREYPGTHSLIEKQIYRLQRGFRRTGDWRRDEVDPNECKEAKHNCKDVPLHYETTLGIAADRVADQFQQRSKKRIILQEDNRMSDNLANITAAVGTKDVGIYMRNCALKRGTPELLQPIGGERAALADSQLIRHALQVAGAIRDLPAP